MATERIVTVESSGGNYTSLSAAEAGEQGNLVSLDRQLTIQCYAMQDTTACVIDGSTTDATRYIRVIVPATEIHDGKWNTSKYRMVVDPGWSLPVLKIMDAYTRIVGVQIDHTGGGSSGYCVDVNTGGTNCLIDRCIFKGASGTGVLVRVSGVVIRNTITYDNAEDGFQSYDGSACTFQNCDAIDNGGVGFRGNYDSFTATNCLAHGNTGADFSASSTPTVTYCASEDATADDWSGAGCRISQTFTFVNYAGDDFHLASIDAGARDYGTSLSGSFTTDIDGQTRSGTWDIGADEYVASGDTALSAAVSCVCTIAAALTTIIRLAASVSCAATVAAQLTTLIRMAASALCSATTSAGLTTQIRMVASAQCVCTVSAALASTADTALSAAVSCAVTAAAQLTTAIPLAASALCSAAVSAALTTAIPLAASVSCIATAAAQLTTQIPLAASVLCSVAVSATLFNPSPFGARLRMFLGVGT